MSSIRKLILHFSHFVGGGTISLLLGLITFPILTRILTREDYGMLGLVTNSVAIAVALAKAGLSDGIIRFYRDYANTPERLALFTSNVVTRGIILAVVVVSAYILVLPVVASWTHVNQRYTTCFLIMALYLLVRPLNIIVLNYLRALGKTLFFTFTNILTKAIGIALALALLLWVIGELYGYFLGIAIAEVGAMIFLFRWLFSNYRFSLTLVSGSLTVNLIRFGFPLLLSELSYLLLSYADRYMIVAFHGEDVLGLYTVGYNIPSYINDLVMFSLSYAVVPIYTDLFVRDGKKATEAFLTRSMKYYLLGMIPLCVGYAAIARDLLVILASNKYAEAATFSPIVLVGLAFMGMNSMLYAGLYLNKKSGLILTTMLTAVAINILANLVLLPRYGALGAAISTLIACIASSLLFFVLTRKTLRVNVSLSSTSFYFAISAAMYLLLSAIDTAHPWLNVVVKIPLGMFITATAVLWREPEMREQSLTLVRRFWTRR